MPGLPTIEKRSPGYPGYVGFLEGVTLKMMKNAEFDQQELLFRHVEPTNSGYGSV